MAQHDVIAPGYDVRLAPFPPKLIRFRDTYETLSGRLSLENVITPRLRGLQELQFTDTTFPPVAVRTAKLAQLRRGGALGVSIRDQRHRRTAQISRRLRKRDP